MYSTWHLHLLYSTAVYTISKKRASTQASLQSLLSFFRSPTQDITLTIIFQNLHLSVSTNGVEMAIELANSDIATPQLPQQAASRAALTTSSFQLQQFDLVKCVACLCRC